VLSTLQLHRFASINLRSVGVGKPDLIEALEVYPIWVGLVWVVNPESEGISTAVETLINSSIVSHSNYLPTVVIPIFKNSSHCSKSVCLPPEPPGERIIEDEKPGDEFESV
jgi:hypothetical protein